MHLPVTAEDLIQQKFLVFCSYPSRLQKRQANKLQKTEISFLESLGHSEVIQFAMWKPASLCEVMISSFLSYTEKGQQKIHGLQAASIFKHPTITTPTNTGSKNHSKSPSRITLSCGREMQASCPQLEFYECMQHHISNPNSAIKINIVVQGFFCCLHPTN